jgi:Ni/Fe-hydrogenase subunit HybB-like protein
MVEASQPLGGKVVTKPFLVLAALAVIGVILIAYRYLFGLGAVTNLSDGYPWGLWITYDVLVGTALGCGGYAMALLVYIFNRWEYHPLVRSAARHRPLTRHKPASPGLATFAEILMP